MCGIHRLVGIEKENPAQLSDVALANIEAIASGEGIPQAPCSEDKFHECMFHVVNPMGK